MAEAPNAEEDAGGVVDVAIHACMMCWMDGHATPFAEEVLATSNRESSGFRSSITDDQLFGAIRYMRNECISNAKLMKEIELSEGWVQRLIGANDIGKEGLSKKGLDRRIGRLVWLAGSANSDNERVVTARLQALSGCLRGRNGKLSPLGLALNQWGENNSLWVRMLWAGRWHASGLPTVSVDDITVAALLFSDTDKLADVDSLHSPWNAFRIKISPLPIQIANGEVHELEFIEVHRIRISGIDNIISKDEFGRATYWRLSACSRSSGHPIVEMRIDCLSNMSKVREMDVSFSIDGELQVGSDVDLTKWALFLIGRLVVGTIALMNRDRTSDNPTIISKNQRRLSRELHVEPDVNYIVRDDVKIDLSPYVRGFILGETKVHRTCQWVTRGHWRNQPCGPQLLNRERIWIHPHWNRRGDGPIAIRDHRLGE